MVAKNGQCAPTLRQRMSPVVHSGEIMSSMISHKRRIDKIAHPGSDNNNNPSAQGREGDKVKLLTLLARRVSSTSAARSLVLYQKRNILELPHKRHTCSLYCRFIGRLAAMSYTACWIAGSWVDESLSE